MVNDVISSLGHNSASDGKCNYITAQTGFTLRDLVSYDCKHNEENGENNTDGPDYNYSWNCGAEGQSRKRSVVNLRKSQIRNAFLLLLLAQGTPCLCREMNFTIRRKEIITFIVRIMQRGGLTGAGLSLTEDCLIT